MEISYETFSAYSLRIPSIISFCILEEFFMKMPLTTLWVIFRQFVLGLQILRKAYIISSGIPLATLEGIPLSTSLETS